MYDWQKPLQIPQYDEPNAGKRLNETLCEVFEKLRFPEPESKGISVRLAWAMTHPDFGTQIAWLPIWDFNMTSICEESVLVVHVCHAKSPRLRSRTYAFKQDGKVVINYPHAKDPDHDQELPSEEHIQGWPQGVRHMLKYVAQVLRQSASWEISLAENLEVLGQKP